MHGLHPSRFSFGATTASIRIIIKVPIAPDVRLSLHSMCWFPFAGRAPKESRSET